MNDIMVFMYSVHVCTAFIHSSMFFLISNSLQLFFKYCVLNIESNVQ